MEKLSLKDFTYYKDSVKDDKQAHSSMLERQLPDEIIDAYEGNISQRNMDSVSITGNMIEDYIFISANTIIPTLFYQMPRPLIRAKSSQFSYSASVIDALVRAYFNDNKKHEIQDCIMDAYLAYPYSVMKVGYNSRRGVYQKPSLLTGQTKGTESKRDMEASFEYLKYEKPFIERQSPKTTLLDSTKDFGKGKRVTFQYKRTLQELKENNLYQLESDFLSYFKGKTEDDRKVSLDIKEHWCYVENKVYKLVYTEDWHNELYWGETSYKTLPIELLRLNKSTDRLYGISHGHLAYQAQKELNYYNELWKEHIDKIKRLHLVYTGALEEGAAKTLENNEIDAIIKCSKPLTTGVYQQIVSTPMGKDVYAGIENVRKYLNLLLSTTGGRGGDTNAEFAYTEKQQAVGDTLRMSGMQDNIRDFVNGILRQEVSNIVRFGDPEITLNITHKNVIDPVTELLITGKELKIGGQDGLRLQEEIKGDIDTDYIYDVDIMSASRPDFAVQRKQLSEYFMVATNPMVQAQLAQEGKKFVVSEFMQDWANTFETLVDPQKYITDITPEEKIAMLQKQMMAQGGMPKQTEGVPNEEAMAQGIQNSAQGV